MEGVEAAQMATGIGTTILIASRLAALLREDIVAWIRQSGIRGPEKALKVPKMGTIVPDLGMVARLIPDSASLHPGYSF